MLSDKLPSEITELWKSYYKDKDAVYAVIPADLYKKVSALRKENPIVSNNDTAMKQQTSKLL